MASGGLVLHELREAEKIAIVTLNNPKKLNAMSFEMFAELEKVFLSIESSGKDIRAIVLTSSGPHFTAGLDLTSASQIGQANSAANDEVDTARIALKMQKLILDLQRQTSVVEKVRVPVIAAMSGYVIGAGIDLSSACDIRVCAKDAKFSIKEIDIGMCADIGTIQRF